MTRLRFVVARLAIAYRQPLSEILGMDLDELAEWAELSGDPDLWR